MRHRIGRIAGHILNFYSVVFSIIKIHIVYSGSSDTDQLKIGKLFHYLLTHLDLIHYDNLFTLASFNNLLGISGFIAFKFTQFGEKLQIVNFPYGLLIKEYNIGHDLCFTFS